MKVEVIKAKETKKLNIDVKPQKEIKVVCSDTFQKEFKCVMEDLRKIDHTDFNKKHFVIVPDNCSYTFEKGVLENVTKSTFNINVFTFSRLLNKLIKSKIQKQFVSPKTGVMIISKIMLDNKGKLKCFDTNISGMGVEESIYNLILQLKSCKITPEMLTSFNAKGNVNLQMKLTDLALIYSEYEAFLLEGYYDSINKLAMLNEALVKSELLDNANIYIAGFSSFTKLESLVISKCIKKASHTTSYITYDSDNQVYMGETLTAFRTIADALNYKLNVIKSFDTLNQIKRAIKNEVFSYKTVTKKVKVTDEVEIYEAQDMFDECSFVMSKINYLVKQKGYRYKDIAVVTQNFEEYGTPLDLAFSSFNIPYFHDEGKKLIEHTLSRYLICLLKIKNGNYVKSDVSALIKNELFELDTLKKYDFENYVIKYLPERYDFFKPFRYGKNKDAELFETAESVRKELVSRLEKLDIKSVDSTANLCNSLKAFLVDNDFETRVTLYEDRMLIKTDNFIKEYSAQAYKMIESVLTWLGSIFKDTYLTLEQFLNIFASGLASQDISIVPTFIDNVFLSDMFDAKLIGKKAVFILNVNDGDLPKPMKDNNILTDKDIDFLKNRDLDINPNIKTANRRNLEEILLVLLGFEENITLSYVNKDSRQSEKKPSQIVKTFIDAFERTDGKPLTQNKSSIISTLNMDSEINLDNLAYVLASERNAKKELINSIRMYKDGFIINKEIYSLVYEALKNTNDMEEIDKLVEVIDEPYKTIVLKNGNELFFYGDTTSISKMQTYYDCPFKHFMQYGLELKERETAELQVNDIGTYMHEIVENFAKVSSEVPLDKTACDKKVEDIVDELIKKDNYIHYLESAKQKCLINSLKREAKRVCFNILGFYNSSDFKFDIAEKPFDASDELNFKVDNREILYTGKIDRIDRNGDDIILIDYKTGNVDYDINDLYLGKKIQLYAYMLAVKDEHNKPCGVFFLPINDKFKKEEDAGSKNRMQGLFLNEENVVKCLDKTLSKENTESMFVPVKLKTNKKGDSISITNTKGSLAVAKDELDKIGEYVKQISSNGIKEILDGSVSASPYKDGNFKDSCAYCSYKRVCKYNDQDFNSERKLDTNVNKQTLIGVVENCQTSLKTNNEQ